MGYMRLASYCWDLYQTVASLLSLLSHQTLKERSDLLLQPSSHHQSAPLHYLHPPTPCQVKLLHYFCCCHNFNKNRVVRENLKENKFLVSIGIKSSYKKMTSLIIRNWTLKIQITIVTK